MKHLLLVALCVIAFSASLNTQVAKVIALSDEDALQAKQLQQEQVALDFKRLRFDAHVRSTYLIAHSREEKGDCSFGSTLGVGTLSDVAGTYKVGWNCGEFLYSDNFKYIVPKPEAPRPRYEPTWQY